MISVGKVALLNGAGSAVTVTLSPVTRTRTVIALTPSSGSIPPVVTLVTVTRTRTVIALTPSSGSIPPVVTLSPITRARTVIALSPTSGGLPVTITLVPVTRVRSVLKIANNLAGGGSGGTGNVPTHPVPDRYKVIEEYASIY